MLRSSLLYLSRSRRIQDFIMNFEFSKRAARRFVAGEIQKDSLEVAKTLNDKGILSIIDHLGENVSKKEEAKAATDEYLTLLEEINKAKVNSQVSLKLTQMGLDISTKICQKNTEAIVKKADKYDNLVQIDMEGSEYTDKTLKIFEKLKEKYENVGVAVQANLYRTENDLKKLIDLGANIRLCKGAYKEPKEIAFSRKRDVDENFRRLLRMLFDERAKKRGVYPCIATHDERMINLTKELANTEFEFQLLYGIRRDLQQRLTEEGYRVRVYVPYGKEWYPFYMRRLAERPANLIFLLKNVVKP
jgi:proline dehydrogenase